jgi:hypothetical protein
MLNQNSRKWKKPQKRQQKEKEQNATTTTTKIQKKQPGYINSIIAD